VLLLVSQAPERRWEWVAALSVTMAVRRWCWCWPSASSGVGPRVLQAFERLMGLMLVAAVEMLLRGLKSLAPQL
jgi:small neutral amino acid transporter SnatA (MarC family)